MSVAGPPDVLRWLLFLGLVAHKLVWEWLKRRDGGGAPERSHPTRSRGTVLVKAAKISVLGAVAVQTLFLDVLPISSPFTALRVVGTAIYALGLATALMGRLALGASWTDLEDYRLPPGQAVVTTGIYGYIRHPIYTGDILLLVGLELALNSWLVLGVAIPALIVVRQARAEEALLARALPGYEAYIRRTKRFVPFVL